MVATGYLLTALLVVFPLCSCQDEEPRPVVSGTEPPCDETNVHLLMGNLDVDKLQGRWYLKYATYDTSGGGFEGYAVDISYQPQAGGVYLLIFTYTIVYGEQDDCTQDSQWTCALNAASSCKNGVGTDFFTIVGIDYDSANGSMVVMTQEYDAAHDSFVYYPILNIFVRDPLNFPGLDDALLEAEIGENCKEGADDPPSAVYTVQPQYSNLPACFL